MNRHQINSFFREFQKSFSHRVTILLTGAAAGSLMGKIRPTLDIDFAVLIPDRSQKRRVWADLEEAIRKTTQATGVAANFAEDIGHWSMISFLDYEKHSRKYKRFGPIGVRILAPEYWAIGKFARYLDPDVQDLISVLKQEKILPRRLANILGRALEESPRSAAQFQFRRQVEHFFKTYGTRIWGKKFSENRALSIFHHAARITP